MANQPEVKVPPNDLDAESAVLACALLDPAYADVVVDMLPPEDLFADGHRRILEAIVSLHADGQQANVVSVAGMLRDRGQLQSVGGAPYLAQLADATPAIARPEQFCRRIRQLARLRRVITVCQSKAVLGHGDVGDIDDWIDSVEHDLLLAGSDARNEADTSGTYGELATETFEIVRERANAGRELAGQSTGLVDVDKLTGGLCDGDLVILAGRPGQGKTTLAQQMAEYAAEREQRAWILFSLEMPRTKLMERTMARRAHVAFHAIRHGRLLGEDWRRLSAIVNGDQETKSMAHLPMVIDDDFRLSPMRVRAKVRAHMARLRKQFGPQLKLGGIAIDYIQLMQGDGGTENRNLELAAISRALKLTAKEFACPVVALSQLNRPQKGQHTKAPNMFDLRESGALEADADCIWFVHREDMYREAGQPMNHKATFIQAKGRNEDVGDCDLYFDGQHSAFANLQREEWFNHGDRL